MVDEAKLDLLLANTGDMCLKRRAKLLITELAPQQNDTILDVGCGDGFYIYLLSQLGDFDLTGIDSDKGAIINAKKQVGKRNVSYFAGDIYKMPFKNETFTKIVLSEVLEHLPDDKRGLLEIKRVLKKNGVICVTVPHWNYPFFWDPINYILQRVFKTHVRSGFWAGVWNFHERLYRTYELKELFIDAGFKIERFDCLTHYGLPFNHYLTNIGFRLRTHKNVPIQMRQSMSKFQRDRKKTWFSYILSFINWFDKRNDRKFSENISTVGLFLKARKVKK